jgi:uncharacterized protein (DUF1501 family)
MQIRRRDFLKTGSIATASLLLPRFLKAFETPGALPNNGKTLVVLQLSGGNDGLNTVVPVRNDVYYRERPRIGIKREEALSLTSEAGLNPALGAFKNLYDDGDLAILNSVGYPNPDRSHFRSMDIWHSASPADQYWQSGWLGRYLDAQCAGAAPAAGSCSSAALEIDDTLSLVLKGEQVKGLAMQDIQNGIFPSAHGLAGFRCTGGISVQNNGGNALQRRLFVQSDQKKTGRRIVSRYRTGQTPEDDRLADIVRYDYSGILRFAGQF